ncbi:M-phase phosphoprotein 6 [Sergentomyia squamirostris]
MSGKAKLSKTILEMKFMKKTRDKVLKAEQSQESSSMYASEITKTMLTGSNIISEQSYVPCEDLLIGRFSFGGMNPELERLLEKEQAEKINENLEEEREMIKDVSDDRMALHYSKVNRNFTKKFSSGNRDSRNILHGTKERRIDKRPFHKNPNFKAKHQ